MESTLLLVGFTLGGILIIPSLTDFIKENLPFLLMGTLLVIGLVLLTPYSQDVQDFWRRVNVIPQAVANALLWGEVEKEHLTNAFHSSFGH